MRPSHPDDRQLDPPTTVAIVWGEGGGGGWQLMIAKCGQYTCRGKIRVLFYSGGEVLTWSIYIYVCVCVLMLVLWCVFCSCSQRSHWNWAVRPSCPVEVFAALPCLWLTEVFLVTPPTWAGLTPAWLPLILSGGIKCLTKATVSIYIYIYISYNWLLPPYLESSRSFVLLSPPLLSCSGVSWN